MKLNSLTIEGFGFSEMDAMNTAQQLLVNIFEPVHDFEPYAPLLGALACIIALVMLGWIVFELVNLQQVKSKKYNRFEQSAGRMNLSRKERDYLLQAASACNLIDPSRLLHRSGEFNRCIQAVEKGGADAKTIQGLRDKLFGSEDSSPYLRNSHNLPAGSRVSLKISGHREAMVHAELSQVEDEGLVISIESISVRGVSCEWLSDSIEKGFLVRMQTGKTVHIPFDSSSRMEVHVTTPSGELIQFFSYVRQVISGPQRMFIAEHSNMLHFRGRNKKAQTSKRFAAPAGGVA